MVVRNNVLNLGLLNILNDKVLIADKYDLLKRSLLIIIKGVSFYSYLLLFWSVPSYVHSMVNTMDVVVLPFVYYVVGSMVAIVLSCSRDLVATDLFCSSA